MSCFLVCCTLTRLPFLLVPYRGVYLTVPFRRLLENNLTSLPDSIGKLTDMTTMSASTLSYCIRSSSQQPDAHAAPGDSQDLGR